MKFNTPYNYRFDENINGRYEENILPSETIPDQTMSVREIFKRYAQGQPLSGNGRTPLDSEIADLMPLDWDKMDISERYEFIAQHKVKLTEAQKAFNEKKFQEDEKAYKQLIIAEYEASQKDQKDQKDKEPKPNP